MNEKIYAATNQKGGVGKSSTTAALTAAAAHQGKKVLLVDGDLQLNCTDTMGGKSGDGIATIYDIFVDGCPAEEVIQHTDCCDLIPGDKLVYTLDNRLQGVIGKEFRLKEALAPIAERYDLILIDTPPQLGILMTNALVAADSALIPVTADRYAMQGMDMLVRNIHDIQKYFNQTLKIDGMLLNKWNPREILSRETLASLPPVADMLGTRIYDTKIENRTALRRAQSTRQTLYQYRNGYADSGRDGMIAAYESLLRELGA